MDACVLSVEEVGRLLNYGLTPCHDEHYHIQPQEAIEGLHKEEYELVTTPEGRNYLTRPKQYMLAARPSGPQRIRTIQRVRMAQLKALRLPR